MVKHNNVVPRSELGKKRWRTRVKCFFNQPAKRAARKNKRVALARTNYPKPTDKLYPVVNCPTFRHNNRVRLGKGFSVAELNEAGLPVEFAKTIGIAVDARRRNRSVDAFNRNVARLNDYKNNLVLFPRGETAKKGPVADTTGVKVEDQTQFKGTIQPIEAVDTGITYEALTEADKSRKNAWVLVRNARKKARTIGWPVKKRNMELSGGVKKGKKKKGKK
eukprot:CAMPEP_0117425448 /NCGR_PEP_ID=MMETSP0758-20121206/5715_1 /TAXON_ID=63605 /ORGANISM="Percolomonas cosmopolitus, Strain AE-1 (ATCC 50343)" /LENGTH=219 /DNA_ID=CAMNT_0005209933 /DNA_START=29 /DNA_END=688 /DNA_ORIENTATION=+